MYWTDWEEDEVNDSIGRIEKAWMDGSNRRIFVTSNMLWPNGLTLDHSTGTMYWCDAYYDHIERIHLNGTGRMVSLTMSRSRTVVKWCRNPFAGLILAVILADWRVNTLVRFKRVPQDQDPQLNKYVSFEWICANCFVSTQLLVALKNVHQTQKTSRSLKRNVILIFTGYLFCISQMLCY